MRGLDQEEFGRMVRNTIRLYDNQELLEVSADIVRILIRGQAELSYCFRGDQVHFQGFSYSSDHDGDENPFLRDIYSRLNGNLELPVCKRCGAEFIPAHAARTYDQIFPEEVCYEKAYKDIPLCLSCACAMTRMHMKRKEQPREGLLFRQQYARGELRMNKPMEEKEPSKDIAFRMAQAAYGCARDTDGIRIQAFDNNHIILDVQEIQKIHFFENEDGMIECEMKSEPDMSNLIWLYEKEVEKTVNGDRENEKCTDEGGAL